MSDNSRFHTGGTIGGKLGCAVVAIIGLPTAALIFFFADNATTACGQSPTCDPEIELLKNVIVLSVILTVIGLSVRFGANAIFTFVRRLLAQRK